MNDTVIKAANLSKTYIISRRQQESYTALRDVLTRGARNFGRKILSPFSNSQPFTTEEFFALKDVSFEIKRGDRVGIIGRNGAGKSTLLKILSRITEPTSGRIEITGRVASLLEVGTGFHPELTGRENIYLNGAILGMSRVEIKRKFDAIVAFAEVESFLDTPVKRYSSGMYVRLAFAIAAHLEPEILLVDEVLAVGDAQFQRKCLGKMEDVSKNEGRTVLYVSHQMGTIAQLCTSAILLHKGEITRSGPVSDVIAGYMSRLSDEPAGFNAAVSRDKDIAIMRAAALDENGEPCNIFTHKQPITIAITCRINKWISGAEIRIHVRDSRRRVFTTDTEVVVNTNHKPEMIVAKAVIPGNLLRPECYFFTL
ncbi:ABC transporter ATP-binding protein, partial [Candidatus Woesearchaeota archaeon]|nr:ABC transporter ATP-binding protein [Candidatus Woesearchaeota archaeon]